MKPRTFLHAVITSHYFKCFKFGAIMYITEHVNTIVMLLPRYIFVHAEEQLSVVCSVCCLCAFLFTELGIAHAISELSIVLEIMML